MTNITTDTDYVVKAYFKNGYSWEDIFGSAWEAMEAVTRITNNNKDVVRTTVTRKTITCETLTVEVA